MSLSSTDRRTPSASRRPTHRVLYLTSGVFDKGGISRYCRYQLLALRELLGTERVTALSLLPPESRGFEVPFSVDFASCGSTPLGKYLLAQAAAGMVAQHRPTLLWCGHVYLAPLALALARIARIPLVLNVYAAELWTNLTWVRRQALRWSDVVVSDCNASLDFMLKNGLRSQANNFVHWDCVDLARFSPGPDDGVLAEYGVPAANGSVRILSLGRLDVYKGFDRLIDAVAGLAQDCSTQLVIVGKGACRAELEERVQRLGLQARVFFTGAVSEADLPRVYRSCDLFSLVTDADGPGRGEGIPLTPLEAAACGKPIIVGNRDGSREAAEHGRSGFVLDPHDQESMIESLRTLIRDPQLRESFGAVGRSRIEKEHSFERFRAHIGDLLESLD